jgi:sterol desaturase/sphingolipid hydroxylase (fatty acid hydroxylase superfamily)
MEAYANALLVAIPAFVLLMSVELFYGYWKGKQTYVFMDTIASLSSGLTNILKDTLGLAVVLISYPWLESQLSLVQIEATPWLYFVAFVCIDFASYWSHRLNHKINVFWNQHIIHHSSEEFNMACALRQSISNVLGYGALFLIPAAFLGIPEEVIALLAPLHLFGQFWYHTRHIGKLGWLEYIIVTPSQHRVHHAINPIYIDKNLAAIFCVWDRMFGTFQEELDEEPPVYGVLKPVHTWNPLLINFMHFWSLTKDAWHTQNWKVKLQIWFRPTGWRPMDVAQQRPMKTVTNVHKLKKYAPNTSKFLSFWATFHLLATLGLLLQMLFLFSSLNTGTLLQIGGALFVAIFGYTSVMDGKKWALWLECIRCLATLGWAMMAVQLGEPMFIGWALYGLVAFVWIAAIRQRLKQ